MRCVMEKEDLGRKMTRAHPSRGGGRPASTRELLAMAKPMDALDRQIRHAELQIAKRDLEIRDMKRTASLARDVEIRAQMNEYKEEVLEMLQEANAETPADLVGDFDDAAREFEEADEALRAEEDAAADLATDAEFDESHSAESESVRRMVADLRARDQASLAEHALLLAEASDRAAAKAVSALPLAPTAVTAVHVHAEGVPCMCGVVSGGGGEGLGR